MSQNLLPLEEARNRILSLVPTLGEESLAPSEALGRFVSRDASSPVPLPPFDNSAMDGYAVRAEDLQSCSRDRPVVLRVIGRAAAGSVFAGALEAGSCVRVFTGSPLPEKADAVVMQEDTEPAPSGSESILVRDPLKPWENVRFRGEDAKVGAKLAECGQRMVPGRVALLAAAGIAWVGVRRQPRVSILATGSELAEPGALLRPGQIYESNRAAMSALLTRDGGVPNILPICTDDPEKVQSAIAAALETADSLITSGGVSVGDYDFIKPALARLGADIAVSRIAMKPGKPFLFARLNGKVVFGLPGNPVSAMVTYLLLVRPAILHMQGASQLDLPATPGTLAQSLSNHGDRRHFVRVVADDAGMVRSAGVQASHVLSSIAPCNGLVDIPPETAWEQGRSVSVLRWNDA